jgi:hypothetical protein
MQWDEDFYGAHCQIIQGLEFIIGRNYAPCVDGAGVYAQQTDTK